MSNKYYTTPKGIASYPKLLKPDTKFNAEGVYTTKLVIPKEDAKELIERIEETFTEEYGEKKLTLLNPPYKEDENGDLLFTFKSKNKPKLFDAAGDPVTDKDLKLGSGSILKIKGAIGPNIVTGKYYATLWINAVQIIDLVEFQGGGFGADESGSYKADRDTTGDDVEDEGVPTPDDF
jgi:uncharacterized protein (DUF779 family)